MVAPDWLSADASTAYLAASAELGGEWTRERLADLEQYACKRALWLEAERALAADGAVLILRTDKGEVKGCQANPYAKIAEDARKVMASLWARLVVGAESECGGPSAAQVARIAESIVLGLPAPAVADSAGVSVGQLRAWLDRGEDGDPECVALVAAVAEVRCG
jgi:hypothetical protein